MKRFTVEAELFIISILTIAIYILASRFDLMERIYDYAYKLEEYQFDEFITVVIFWVFALAIFSFRRWREVVLSEQKLARYNKVLESALTDIKQLKGMIPICASCKKIRDDDGYWHQVEVYIQAHSEADFSHGVCPDCVNALYPELLKEE